MTTSADTSRGSQDQEVTRNRRDRRCVRHECHCAQNKTVDKMVSGRFHKATTKVDTEVKGSGNKRKAKGRRA
jgi:hypothetical protein